MTADPRRFVRRAEAEASAYFGRLCKEPIDERTIVLACHDAARAQPFLHASDGFGSRAPGSFALRTREQDGRPCVGVIGRDPIGVLYGTYALIEEMGATFTLSGDLLPSPTDRLALPHLDRLCEPALARHRGFLIPMLDVNSAIQGFADYKLLIDQMVKLRLNYINFCLFAAEPWVDYEFRGEKNGIGDVNSLETGYLVPKLVVGDPSTDNIRIGREHFCDRPHMAPLELQDVRDREDGITRFQTLMHRVMDYAGECGVDIGLSTDLTQVPPNFAKHMKAQPLPDPARTIFGQKVDPLDPVMLEHARVMLEALFETYPQIADFYVFNPEGYHYRPEADELYDRMKPLFANARQTFERNWIETCPYARNGKTSAEVLEVDIAHFESARRGVEVARQVNPDLPIGMAFLFRGYLLQDADKLIDRDVPFMEYQSSGVVAIRDDVNASYFAGMGERERQVIARVDDDGSMFGIPFYLRQFQRDGLFREAAAAGVTGLAAQLWRVRGTEHHTRFLALGAWNPDLTPERFYEEYARDIFGAQACAPMQKAFTALEDCEELLGWRGMKNFRWADGCRELATLGPPLLQQDKPYQGPHNPEAMLSTATKVTVFEDTRIQRDTMRDGKIEVFRKAAGLLGLALEHLQDAALDVSAKGKGLLDYLVSKTGAYQSHLDMVALLCQGFADYARAFRDLKDDKPALADALEGVSRTFQAANSKARESAQRAAEIVDHPSDLAVLFQVNRFNVEGVEKVATLVRRVCDYHRGIPWEDAVPGIVQDVEVDDGWNN